MRFHVRESAQPQAVTEDCQQAFSQLPPGQVSSSMKQESSHAKEQNHTKYHDTLHSEDDQGASYIQTRSVLAETETRTAQESQSNGQKALGVSGEQV